MEVKLREKKQAKRMYWFSGALARVMNCTRVLAIAGTGLVLGWRFFSLIYSLANGGGFTVALGWLSGSVPWVLVGVMLWVVSVMLGGMSLDVHWIAGGELGEEHEAEANRFAAKYSKFLVWENRIFSLFVPKKKK